MSNEEASETFTTRDPEVNEIEHHGEEEIDPIYKSEYEHSRKESLPQLPTPAWDATFSVESILKAAGHGEPSSDAISITTSTVEKRASRVMKLAEEKEKLDAKLKALSDRLAAAKKRTEEEETGRKR